MNQRSFKEWAGDYSLNHAAGMTFSKQIFKMASLGIEYESLHTIRYFVGTEAVPRSNANFTKGMTDLYKAVPSTVEKLSISRHDTKVSPCYLFVQTNGSVAGAGGKGKQLTSVGDLRCFHVRNLSEYMKTISDSHLPGNDILEKLSALLRSLFAKFQDNPDQDVCKGMPHWDRAGNRIDTPVPCNSQYSW